MTGQAEIVVPTDRQSERTVKFTDGEWALLQRAADAVGMTRHAFNRKTLLEVAEDVIGAAQ